MSSGPSNLLACQGAAPGFPGLPEVRFHNSIFDGHATRFVPGIVFGYFSTRKASISVRVEASSSNLATVAMTSSTRAAARRALA